MGWGDAGVVVADVDAGHRLTAAAAERALAGERGRSPRDRHRRRGGLDGDRRVRSARRARRRRGARAGCGSTSTRRTAAASRCRRRHRDQLPASSAPTRRVGRPQAADDAGAGHRGAATSAATTPTTRSRRRRRTCSPRRHPRRPGGISASAALECTKRMMSIELWCALRSHGDACFADVVDRQIALTHELAAKLRATSDFEVALAPDVEHRVLSPPLPGSHRSRRPQPRRSAAGSSTTAGSTSSAPSSAPGYHLRSTLMNPLTEPSDLRRAARAPPRAMPLVTILRGPATPPSSSTSPPATTLFDAGREGHCWHRHRVRRQGHVRPVPRQDHRRRRAPEPVHRRGAQAPRQRLSHHEGPALVPLQGLRRRHDPDLEEGEATVNASPVPTRA